MRVIDVFSGALLAASLAMAASTASAGGEPVPAIASETVDMAAPAPPRTARIPQGATVELAASAFSASELAAKRPGYQDLRPRARTNAE